jgi:predicted nucleotidyltransferase
MNGPALLATRRWEHPGLERVGLFGSYGRGDAGVGSDLDLLLIVAGSSGPQHQRLLAEPVKGKLPIGV